MAMKTTLLWSLRRWSQKKFRESPRKDMKHRRQQHREKLLKTPTLRAELRSREWLAALEEPRVKPTWT